MLILLVIQLGVGIYGLVKYDTILEKGLTATLQDAKDNPNIGKAWDALQYNVSANTNILKSLQPHCVCDNND